MATSRAARGDERTLHENVAAYERWRLRPRVLKDVSAVSAATTVLGRSAAMPLLVAPTPQQLLAHPGGESGMARAAAAAGTVHCLSMSAGCTPTEVAAAAPDGRAGFEKAIHILAKRAELRWCARA